ncbi:MAG: M48 family metalloprotease, partial [Alphaproteobacteria bacterium]|nr:M48 family metalloprotease [Alphaproteobacteria bacterium]
MRWIRNRLLTSRYGCPEVEDGRMDELTELVRALAVKAELPAPRVFVVNGERPNAFVTGLGPQYAALCVTRGLLIRLDRKELAAVLAHELAHIKHGDILAMSLASMIGACQAMLAKGGRSDTLFVGIGM